MDPKAVLAELQALQKNAQILDDHVKALMADKATRRKKLDANKAQLEKNKKELAAKYKKIDDLRKQIEAELIATTSIEAKQFGWRYEAVTAIREAQRNNRSVQAALEKELDKFIEKRNKLTLDSDIKSINFLINALQGYKQQEKPPSTPSPVRLPSALPASASPAPKVPAQSPAQVKSGAMNLKHTKGS